MAFGVLLRLRQYLSNRSLWIDEARLALNVINKPLSALFQPLDYKQGAPVGFLALSKLAVLLFGNSEYALRLIPLLSGLAAILLFYAVARRCIRREALPVGVCLFAVSGPLIYYSSEFKQYSGDVAVGLLIVWLGTIVQSKPLKATRLALLAIVGAIAAWFSHPSLFVMAGVGLSLGFSAALKREWNRLIKLSIVGLFWLLSFALFYIVSLQHLIHDPHILGYRWQAFMPFPPRSLSDAQWFIHTAFTVFRRPVGLLVPGIGLFACILGCISLFRRNRQTGAALLLPILLAFLASGIGKYPITARTILFAAPLLIILVAEGVEYVRNSTMARTGVIGVLLICMLLIQPVFLAADRLATPHTKEEIRPVLRYVEQHRQEGDILYVYYGALPAFRYYCQRYERDERKFAAGVQSRTDWRKYYKDLEKLVGNERVWVIFSHIYKWQGVDEEKLFLSYLNERGKRLDRYIAEGASAYLYNLQTALPET